MTIRSMSTLLSMLAATAILNAGCGDDSPFMNADTIDPEDSRTLDSNAVPDESYDTFRPDRDDMTPDIPAQPDTASPDTAAPDHGSIDTPDDAPGMDSASPNCDLDGITCIFLRHDSIEVQGAGAIGVRHNRHHQHGGFVLDQRDTGRWTDPGRHRG